MRIETLLPEGTEVFLSDFALGGQPGREGVKGLVRLLQYEVREGREADEAVIIPTAFIARRDSSFILLEVVGDEEGLSECQD